MPPKNKVKILTVSPIMDNQAIKKLEGTFFEESAFSQIINEDADVWVKLQDGSKKLLLKFSKGIIPLEINQLTME